MPVTAQVASTSPLLHARQNKTSALRSDAAPVANPSTQQSILQLQRLCGNAAVRRMLQPDIQRQVPSIQKEGPFGGFPGLPDFGDLPGIDDLPIPQIPSLEDLPLDVIVDQFAPDGPSIAPNPNCTSDFCAPISTRTRAQAFKGVVAGPILAGIAAKVNTRVVGLWRQHIFGGAPPQDLSSEFGTDFTSSRTTARVTNDLVAALKANIEATPPTFPPGVDTVTIDIPSRIPTDVAALDDPADPARCMDFDVINEIPGNLAGGIGKNQLTTPVGAQPAPFDDSRTAIGTATVTKNPDGTMTISTNITFTIRDTIDLCPGNCGASVEQTATRPLSWLEASGVSGDVPFTVRFAAPPRTVTTNPVTPPAPIPTSIEGETTASSLRIRQSADTSAPIVGRYPRGTRITIECQTTGTEVDGNSRWDKTDQGFVSDRYVHRLSPDDPPNC